MSVPNNEWVLYVAPATNDAQWIVSWWWFAVLLVVIGALICALAFMRILFTQYKHKMMLDEMPCCFAKARRSVLAKFLAVCVSAILESKGPSNRESVDTLAMSRCSPNPPFPAYQPESATEFRSPGCPTFGENRRS